MRLRTATVLLGFLLASSATTAQNHSECYVEDLDANWREGVWEVIVRADTAFVAIGQCLDIVDIANPATPVRIGRVVLPDVARDFVLDGATAYVANHRDGLRVVDFSEPSTPVEIGSIDLPNFGTAELVAVGESNRVFVGAEGFPSDLYRVDASDPSALVLDDSLETPSSQPLAVAAMGEYVFIATADTMLVLSSTGSAPMQRVNAFASRSMDISFSSPLAFFAEIFSPSGESGQLRIMDISNPAAAFDVGGIDTAFGYNLGMEGGLAVVGGANGDIEVIDVSDPSSPVFITTLDHLLPPITNPGSVTVTGTLALIGHVSEGLFLIDLTDPANPSLIGQYAPMSTAVEEPPEDVGAILTLDVYPNPAQRAAAVRVVLQRPAHLSVTVFDILGRQIQVIHDAALQAGTHTFEHALAALPAGVYLVRAEVDGVAVTKTLVRAW